MGDDTGAQRLTADRIRSANERKRAFLESFAANGGRFAEGNRSKPLVGPLNPGCRTCIGGTWSCLYLNTLCTQDCFFCPQERRAEADGRASTDDGLVFTSPEDYAGYLRAFPFEGVGISGGEPLRTFDRLVAYVRAARGALGPAAHLWVYTNGDLATDGKLRELAASGLDELRFNLVPGGYDPRPLERAARHIPAVTVEVPVIPEDAPALTGRLRDFAAAGARYVNLHQLMRTEHNAPAIDARGYAVTHAGRYLHGCPVVDSELCAFDLLEHALSSGDGLGVNYCTRCYKGRFQERAYRRRHAAMFGRPAESLTDAAYLRRAEPAIPSEVSRMPDAADVTYFDLTLKPAEDAAPDGGATLEFGGNRVVLSEERVYGCRLANPTAVLFFRRHFCEGAEAGRIQSEAAEIFRLDGAARAGLRDDFAAFRALFEGLEFLASDLPDYD